MTNLELEKKLKKLKMLICKEKEELKVYGLSVLENEESFKRSVKKYNKKAKIIEDKLDKYYLEIRREIIK